MAICRITDVYCTLSFLHFVLHFHIVFYLDLEWRLSEFIYVIILVAYVYCELWTYPLHSYQSVTEARLHSNAIACVSCGFRLRNARNASDCVWMETGLECVFLWRLHDIVHCEKKLYMVFEFLALDLKKYMDTVSATGLPMPLVKVACHGCRCHVMWYRIDVVNE